MSLRAVVTRCGIVATGLAACSAPALPPGYDEAQTLERQGRYAEAGSRYEAAARGCKARRRDCALTELRAAQMLARQGRREEARRAFLAVEQRTGRGLAVGAWALVHAAELQGGAEAEALRWRVVDGYPETTAADEALRRIVQAYRGRGQSETLLTLLRERYLRLRHQEIADNLMFEAARLLEHDLGRPEPATTFYLELARAHPGSSLRDDALFAAGRLLVRAGRFVDALVTYRQLLATREDSTGAASYHSEFLDDAQLAIGRIYLLHLGKPREAAAAFAALVTDFPTSVLRDDALLWQAVAQVEAGQPDAARRTVASLKERFPDSKLVAEAALLEDWIAFRALARAGAPDACARWSELARRHPRSWLVRKGPRPAPWPRCAPEAAP
jgi:tetratricopeptide (TPR) repeat protein